MFIGLSLHALKDSRNCTFLVSCQGVALWPSQQKNLAITLNFCFSENCGDKTCCIYGSDLGLPWSLNQFEYSLNELQWLEILH